MGLEVFLGGEGQGLVEDAPVGDYPELGGRSLLSQAAMAVEESEGQGSEKGLHTLLLGEEPLLLGREPLRLQPLPGLLQEELPRGLLA